MVATQVDLENPWQTGEGGLEGVWHDFPPASKTLPYATSPDGLASQSDEILAANEKDIQAGRRDGLSDSILDRLLLNAERLSALADDVRAVAALPDPLGESFRRTRVAQRTQGRKATPWPLGVVGAIYENRPNVTIDIAVLCLKSGNAVILRGGREAINSNTALAGLVQGLHRRGRGA